MVLCLILIVDDLRVRDDWLVILIKRLHSAKHSHVAFEAQYLLLLNLPDLVILDQIILKVTKIFLVTTHLLFDYRVLLFEGLKILFLFFDSFHLLCDFHVSLDLSLLLLALEFCKFSIFALHLFLFGFKLSH